jgi:hypothetical protein
MDLLMTAINQIIAHTHEADEYMMQRPVASLQVQVPVGFESS